MIFLVHSKGNAKGKGGKGEGGKGKSGKGKERLGRGRRQRLGALNAACFSILRAHNRAPFLHAPRRLPASPRYEGGRGVGGGDSSVQRTQHPSQQAP